MYTPVGVFVVVSLGANCSSQRASGVLITLEAIQHVSKVVEGCPVQFYSCPTVVVNTMAHGEHPPVATGVFGRLIREEALHNAGSV